MIVSPEVIVEAAGPLGDAPSRPIKAFYNLCGYDPSEESPILLSWIGDFFLSGGLPKMATCSESKQFTVCSGLLPVIAAQIGKAAVPALRGPCRADGAAVVYQTMTQIIPLFRGDDLF